MIKKIGESFVLDIFIFRDGINLVKVNPSMPMKQG